LKLDDIFAEQSNENIADIKELSTKVADLELVVRKLKSAQGVIIHPSETLRKESAAPALSKEIRNGHDPWKGLFGGRRENEGFTLSASFRRIGDFVEVNLAVKALDTTTDLQVAEFFLHPTFPRQRINVPFEKQVAKLKFLTWGGFTVGVWIPARKVELELDLAAEPDAPAIVRDR
jgi:hypothetical protein